MLSLEGGNGVELRSGCARPVALNLQNGREVRRCIHCLSCLATIISIPPATDSRGYLVIKPFGNSSISPHTDPLIQPSAHSSNQLYIQTAVRLITPPVLHLTNHPSTHASTPTLGQCPFNTGGGINHSVP